MEFVVASDTTKKSHCNCTQDDLWRPFFIGHMVWAHQAANCFMSPCVLQQQRETRPPGIQWECDPRNGTPEPRIASQEANPIQSNPIVTALTTRGFTVNSRSCRIVLSCKRLLMFWGGASSQSRRCRRWVVVRTRPVVLLTSCRCVLCSR